MSLTMEEIARAISSHHFDAALPYLTEDVSWRQVGAESIVGRHEVIRVLERSTADMAGLTTNFSRFRTAVGDDFVVIDSLAEYTSANGDVSTVASCDIYDFRDGHLSDIVSYNIEVTDT